MIIKHPFRKIMLAVVLAGAAALPAMAQVSININLAPPAPQYEAVPVLAPTQVWAPGYWAWTGERHVWVRGHAIMKRDGYRWSPDRWEQKGNTYYRQPGNWVRETNYVYVKNRKPKHDKHEEKHEDQHRGKGHDRGHGERH